MATGLLSLRLESCCPVRLLIGSRIEGDSAAAQSRPTPRARGPAARPTPTTRRHRETPVRPPRGNQSRARMRERRAPCLALSLALAPADTLRVAANVCRAASHPPKTTAPIMPRAAVPHSRFRALRARPAQRGALHVGHRCSQSRFTSAARDGFRARPLEAPHSLVASVVPRVNSCQRASP